MPNRVCIHFRKREKALRQTDRQSSDVEVPRSLVLICENGRQEGEGRGRVDDAWRKDGRRVAGRHGALKEKEEEEGWASLRRQFARRFEEALWRLFDTSERC